jgi:hypothetical protein
MGGDDTAVQRAHRIEHRRCAHAVALLHHHPFGRRLGQVDLQQGSAVLGFLGHRGQPVQRHRVHGVGSEAHR